MQDTQLVTLRPAVCVMDSQQRLLSQLTAYRWLGEVSSSLASACYMPWQGARRLWVRFVAKLVTAWNTYHAGVRWPYGRMSQRLLAIFRRQQYLPM